MTGDDHGNGGTDGPVRHASRREPGRLLGRGLAVRPGDVVRLSRARRSPAPTAFEARRASRSRCTSTRAARTTRRASLAANWSDQLPAFRSHVPEPRRRRGRTARTASPGATGRASRSSSARRRPAGHELLLLARAWVHDRPGHVHRLGHADALRRPRRLDHRRLPGRDADDRRVGDRLRARTSRRCSTARSARRATTACSRPTCTRTAPSARRAPTRSSPRRKARGVPVISARADARLARRPQRLLVPRACASPATGWRSRSSAAAPAPRAGGDAPGRRAHRRAPGVTRGGAPVATSPRTVKGIEYAVFDAAAGEYAATYGTGRRSPPPPETTITAFTVTGNAAQRRVHVRRAGRRVRVPPGRRAPSPPAPARGTYTGLASGQHTFRCGRSRRRAAVDPTPAERIFTVRPPRRRRRPPAAGGESGGSDARARWRRRTSGESGPLARRGCIVRTRRARSVAARAT